jgi:pyruvate oxidase
MAKFRCSVCNWVFDEEKEGRKFASLPASYTCPVCGAPKTAFVPEGIQTEEGTARETVADKIIGQLAAFGVRHIYGIPGDSNLPLIEAIRKNKGIRFILTRHEETAAFMASAHGKMTGSLGACISIAGPGSTNLITGLMDSATDRSPVVALAGQVPAIYLGSEAFQEIDQIEIFRPFASYAETVSRANHALKMVLMAVKYAYARPGVSVLSTPTDVLVEGLSEPFYIPEKRLFTEPFVAAESGIEKAVKLINRSAKPVIFAGWGARHCGKLIAALSKKIKAPVATTSRAKGVVDEADRYSVGVLGSIGSKHAALAVKNADLILIIGSGFRQANIIPSGIKFVQIDHDATRIGKTFSVDAGLTGDACLTLERLTEKVAAKKGNTAFLGSIEKIRKEHFKELEEDANNLSLPIHPGYVIQAIKRNVKKDAIICVDVGDHTYWFYKKFVCSGQRTFMCANMASMGFALPAALSAKLDFPASQVVCITGDGGFSMLMADFTTAVRENLAIKIIIFNDGKLKNIKKEQLRDKYAEFGVSFPNPDFAAFAKTCGGEGFRVEKPKELDNALKKAFASVKPCVVEILTDPDRMAPATRRVD